MEYVGKKKAFSTYGSDEMKYLKSKREIIQHLHDENLSIDVYCESIFVKIVDKLFFITYEKVCAVTLQINHISAVNSRCDDLLPIEELMNENIFLLDNLERKSSFFESLKTNNQKSKKSKIKNTKGFDFELISKVFHQFDIELGEVGVMIDNEVFIETNLNVKLINSVLNNLPFLPDNIIDMNSRKIHIGIYPSLIKLVKLVQNIEYYYNLYSKQYNLNNKTDDDNAENYNEKIKKDENLQHSTIVEFFQKELKNKLLELIEDEKANKYILSYLKNRMSTIFYYTVGKAIEIDSAKDLKDGGKDQKNSNFDENKRQSKLCIEGKSDEAKLQLMQENGIYIELCECDETDLNFNSIKVGKFNRSLFRHNSTNDLFNNANNNMSKFNSNNNPSNQAYFNSGNLKHAFSTNNYQNNTNTNQSNNAFKYKILTLHMPLLIFQAKESLFYEEKTLWTSDLKAHQTKTLEKINIAFDYSKKMKFSPIEFLFCKNFMNSISFLENNSHTNDLSDLSFTSLDFPFDLTFNSGNIELRNAFHQISYYYEEDLGKVYSKLFYGNNKSERQSKLDISIEHIKLKLFSVINSKMFNLIHNIKIFQNMYEDLENDKIEIKDYNDNEKDFNNKDYNKLQLEESDYYNHNNNNNNNTSLKPKKKLSTHSVKIYINKISLRFYYKPINKHNNLMALFVVKDISYAENNVFNGFLNINSKTNKSDNTNKDSSNNNHRNNNNNSNNVNNLFNDKAVLANFFISNIKLICSIPQKFSIEPNNENFINNKQNSINLNNNNLNLINNNHNNKNSNKDFIKTGTIGNLGGNLNEFKLDNTKIDHELKNNPKNNFKNNLNLIEENSNSINNNSINNSINSDKRIHIKVVEDKTKEELISNMKKEENKLIVLSLGNINLRFIESAKKRIGF